MPQKSLKKSQTVHIIGAGLAGCEAAWFLAEQGVQVSLLEMRPGKMTEAHKSDKPAELVCSNTFKSNDPESGPGMLKVEMDKIGSLILKCAREAAVPGGQALSVDRERFSESIQKALQSHPNIQFIHGEVSAPVEGNVTLIATGPLTSEPLAQWIAGATAKKNATTTDLYFYDAIAPIVEADSIDRSKCFLANRNEKGGEAAYLNCGMNEAEYHAFVEALATAEKVPSKNFEKEIFFQGCQPIEAIAATGKDSLRFGPMRPVGLTDPETGRRPYAVVQLRPENLSKTAYNLVGFQTKLKYGEQKRILSLIPALKNAEFLRMGSVHRNTYVCGPRVLNPDLSLKGHPLVYLAGQITGVEGYLDSSACGMMAAVFIWQRLNALAHHAPPPTTAMGALLRHVTAGDPAHFQPANINFGLFEPLFFKEASRTDLKKDQLRSALLKQANEDSSRWASDILVNSRHSQTSYSSTIDR